MTLEEHLEQIEYFLRQNKRIELDDALDLLRLIEVQRTALLNVYRGIHTDDPVCMTLESGEFGPPATNGWRGWVESIHKFNKETAKDALNYNPFEPNKDVKDY